MTVLSALCWGIHLEPDFTGTVFGEWTRKELIAVFNLYCQLPFGKLHKTNPQIVQSHGFWSARRHPSA